MVHLLIVLGLFHATAPAQECAPEDTGVSGQKMVERINERYDDFFRYQRHQEERDRERNKGRGENKARLAQREKQIEKARQEYVRNRRPPPDRRDLEAQFEAAQKKRVAKNEAARRCYVQQRQKAEQILKRGRLIPGNLEYQLE